LVRRYLSTTALELLAEPPDTDPYVRWCGRGEVVRLPPIPIAALARACQRSNLVPSLSPVIGEDFTHDQPSRTCNQHRQRQSRRQGHSGRTRYGEQRGCQLLLSQNSAKGS